MPFLPLFTGIRHLAHVLSVPPTKAWLLCATPAGLDLYIQFHARRHLPSAVAWISEDRLFLSFQFIQLVFLFHCCCFFYLLSQHKYRCLSRKAKEMVLWFDECKWYCDLMNAVPNMTRMVAGLWNCEKGVACVAMQVGCVCRVCSYASRCGLFTAAWTRPVSVTRVVVFLRVLHALALWQAVVLLYSQPGLRAY